MARSKTSEAPPSGAGPLLICTGICLALALASARFGPDLARLLLDLARLLLVPLAYASDHYAAVLARLASAPSWQQPEPGQALALLQAVCRPYVFCVGLPLSFLYIALGWRTSVADVYRRTLTMKGLLATQKPFSACIAPILNWPVSLLEEPLDRGPWRAGRQPVQLAVDHGLLLSPAQGGGRPVAREDMVGPDNLARADSPWLGRTHKGLALDRERARRLFAAQLGPRWAGWHKLPPELAKLSCAWMLFASDHKNEAQALLDELSLSFRAPEKARKARWQWTPPFRIPARRGHPYLLDTHLNAATRALCEQALNSPLVQKALRPHSTWRNLALLALYEAARSKGVLPTAEFIWLRPVHRELFYLCNNVGRRTAWPEIAGALAHYQAEEVLGHMDAASRGIVEPQVEEAVTSLEVALYEEGWISPDALSEQVAGKSRNLGLDDPESARREA